MRSGKMMEEEMGEQNYPLVQKNMDSYEKIFASNTEFFSSYNPEII
jgi:hypothetical protein